MKKIFLYIVSAVLLTTYSCKTSSHGSCDAYGQVEDNQESDIHKLNIEASKKYMTVTTVRLN
jgi:hypothetical protein